MNEFDGSIESHLAQELGKWADTQPNGQEIHEALFQAYFVDNVNLAKIESLIKIAAQGALSSINVAVDTCNAVSLHSGLPISVVDLDLARDPFRVGLAPQQSIYAFHQSGQTIDVSRLLCLFDAEGPCANAVKDSQRTKTRTDTRRTLSLIWGTNQLPGRAEETEAWYGSLLKRHGAHVDSCWQ